MDLDIPSRSVLSMAVQAIWVLTRDISYHCTIPKYAMYDVPVRLWRWLFVVREKK